ncbi:pectinesterase family protein [Halalkalibacter urbisdiaboli]|uniref:pectinesterase family protein n=1 Tax=Halalkalibacter urbisdiaboli TaxID=1960589 RepID=UPI000B44369B|nr:pectinesterase family protein [Halalkalibacter urbisdiaboli]
METIVVDLNGTGNFTSIQEAIDSVRVLPLKPVTIFVKKGIYHEKVCIPDTKPTLSIIGEHRDETIITYNDYAEKLDANGKPLGTFRTSTLTVHADDVQLNNITIQNSAGYGKGIGQAVALYVAGDRGIYKNIACLGNQDTLYTSRGRHYFLDCYIEGHVDFIFGSATAVFNRCEIHSLRNGYITAASTPADSIHGFVFFNCKLTAEAKQHSVYLGRPWRPYAKTVFIQTWMGDHIIPEGWDNWRNTDNEKTVFYGEFESDGPGFHPEERVNWSKQLSLQEVERLTVENIFNEVPFWSQAKG